MITQKIIEWATLTPEKVAIEYGSQSISYGNLTRSIEQYSNKLFAVSNDTVLFNSDPVTNLLGVLACNLIGKRAIVLPHDLDVTILENIISESKGIIYEDFKLVDLGNTKPVKPAGNKVFLGILSSGSSGKPKLIWKTNNNWESAFSSQSEIFGISVEDKVFVLDSLAYSANLNTALHTLWQGGTLYLGTLGQSRNWNLQMKEKGITSAFLVPSHCKLLLNGNGVKPPLRSLVTAGEKLDKETARGILDNLEGIRLTEYYGAAELGHISYHQGEDIINFPASVGTAFPEVEIKIVEEQILVKSPFVSPDYKEKSTVNDLGFFNGNRLVLLGRAGRMFNRRGLNIYAQEIESIALGCEFISEAVLIQNLNGYKRDKLTLYITKKGNGEQDAVDQLKAYLFKKLPSAKRPNFIVEIPEIPHSEAGKVDFRALSKMGEEEVALV